MDFVGEILSQCRKETGHNLISSNSTQVMHIVPPESRGVRRAVLIGINYTGQQGALRGCHNDVKNIKEYLIKAQGFKESDMLILMDDGQHHPPTKKNIEQAFVRITQYSKAGDVVFVHYSGHGSRVRDTSGKTRIKGQGCMSNFCLLIPVSHLAILLSPVLGLRGRGW